MEIFFLKCCIFDYESAYHIDLLFSIKCMKSILCEKHLHQSTVHIISLMLKILDLLRINIVFVINIVLDYNVFIYF